MAHERSMDAGSATNEMPSGRRSRWKSILIVIIVLLLVFAGVVAMQPDEMKIVRSATIAAPAADIFPHVNDFHAWDAWSPWAKLDEKAKNTYEGPDSGVGAIFKWSGNDQVGEGQMTLVESQPNERIKIKLDFKRPMEDSSDVTFTFKPDGNQTLVTWDMTGTTKPNFVAKAFMLIFRVEKTVGEQFSQGLASLRNVVEKPQK